MKKNIGFIGFGLIAGSIAKSIKKNCSSYKLFVYNRKHPEVPDTLIMALNEEMIDGIYSSIDEFKDCDIIFLCAPVTTNISYLNDLKHVIKDSCIITDIGSVKGNIHEAVTALSMESNFIGGHPMTGSNRTGYENSSAQFMENAFYIITSTSKTKDNDMETMRQLISSMGSIPIIINYEEHDVITAVISHLPHIIAVSLVNIVHENDTPEEYMKKLAAGGFKDITRIASSSPEMWQSICVSNSENINKYIDIFIEKLTEFKHAITKKDIDYIFSEFKNSRDYRDSIPSGALGSLPKYYEVYVDVPDVPGIIALIATILSNNSVNIKNIGIIHNREFENGVLRIEFNNEKDMTNAIMALKKHSYTLYDR